MPTLTTEVTTETRAVLKEHFGFDRFLPGQGEVVEHLLAGRSVAAVFPTGGGKSLCYQLPAVLLPGLTLVISPLIALMKDQVDALAARSIPAARLDSTLDAESYREVMDDARSGRLRMLYIAPERFANERFRETISRIRVSLFAVDEAHCISEWGHNFRPDYLKLAGLAKMCRAERVLALTATATPQVLEDICRAFEIAPECAVCTGFYRPNLTVLLTATEAQQRDAQLLERLTQRPPGPTIVYVTLQRTAEEVAKRLCAAGFDARAYHAGIKAERREATQDWFLASSRGVVVATIAFGMGIDKADIRYVYHYNLPKSLENYSQEIGRAGRDGGPSTCEMLLCADDLCVLENFVYGDTPTLDAVRGFVNEVFSLDEQFDVSHYEISSAHDIRFLVARTLLTYLELDGYLEGGTPFYSTYQFKPLATSAEILSRFDEGRREFLAGLFRQATKAKTWFHIDVHRAAAALACDRQRVVRALDHLGEVQLLEVQSAGVRHRYRRLRAPEDRDALAQSLHERAVHREKRDLARLSQVVELAEHDGCQVTMLGEHFGESRPESCGHCSWCLGNRVGAALPKRRAQAIDEAVWAEVRALQAEHRDLLDSPHVLARLLCGVTSPKLTKAKLTKHPLFGRFQEVPYRDVLARVGDLS